MSMKVKTVCVCMFTMINSMCLYVHNDRVSQLNSRGEIGLQVYTHERENINHGYDSTNGHPLYCSVETQQWNHTNNPKMGSNRRTADRKFLYSQIYIRHKSRATEEWATHDHLRWRRQLWGRIVRQPETCLRYVHMVRWVQVRRRMVCWWRAWARHVHRGQRGHQDGWLVRWQIYGHIDH